MAIQGGSAMKPKALACACCGEYAGTWTQWPNQDTGTGLCARCADWIIERDQRKPAEFRTDMVQTYGEPGVHREVGPKYEAPWIAYRAAMEGKGYRHDPETDTWSPSA